MEACWVATPLNDRRKYLKISKKQAPQFKPFKKLNSGGPSGGTTKLCQNTCSLNIRWYKNIGTLG